MDDSSPLAVQFKEFDTDGDNKLTPDQVYELLKLLGKNIYKGSVSSAAKKLNYADDNPSYNSLFTFGQFKEFYESLDNPLRHDIWKGKYNILQSIKQIRDAAHKKEESATAAPGAKPVVAETPFKGDIEITVGPTNQVYDSLIHVIVEKTPKAQSKPFIKIVFDQTSNQKAKQLQERFKKLQTSLFDLMKSSDPESAEILDYIHIITNVAQNKLNIFITTSNQPLIDLGTVVADFIDQVLGTKVEARVEFKHEFCVDINKFVDKTSDYSFYHALTKSYHTRLQWNATNFKEAAKDIFKAAQLYQDLKYDSADPLSIILIMFLHTELVEASLVFDNADIPVTELETKEQILKELGEIYAKVSEEGGDLGIFDAIASFENKIHIEASIGDWKLQANIQIKDLKELFSNKIAPEVNPQAQQQQVQQQIQLIDINANQEKALSHGSSQNSYDSQSSMKKPKKKKSLSSTPPKPKVAGGQEKKLEEADSDSDV